MLSLEGEPASITIQRRIEWSDTDASGYWHNVAAFRWFEWVETALLKSLGLMDELYGHLPRVHVSADFSKRLKHHDLVDITIRVAAIGSSSMTYTVSISHDGDPVAEGRLVVVLTDPDNNPRPFPDRHREVLLHAGPQPSERLVSG